MVKEIGFSAISYTAASTSVSLEHAQQLYIMNEACDELLEYLLEPDQVIHLTTSPTTSTLQDLRL